MSSARTPLLLARDEDDDDEMNEENNGLRRNEEIKDYNPVVLHADRSHMTNLTSNMETMMHLLKGNIGTGMLAMAFAFKYAGLWTGLIGIFLMAYLCISCMHSLLGSCHHLCTRLAAPALDYGQVVEEAFRLGPMRLRRFSGAAKLITNVFLCITQLGFGCVYFAFIAQNIQMVVDYYYPHLNISMQAYMAMFLPIMILYTFIQHLDHYAPFSALSNAIFAVGLIIIFIHTLHDIPDVRKRPFFNSVETLPVFFGTAIYAFEGIGVILPIENKMKNPEDFGGKTGVLNTGMVVVTVLYASVGFYGYLKYGDQIEGSITLNMPQDQGLFQSVKILFAVGILLSYGIQMYVPIQILWPPLRGRITSRRGQIIGEYAFRVGIVLFTFAVAAVLGRNLGLFISLVGACSSSALALIFPPIIETVTFWPNTGKYHLSLLKNIAIMCFGLVGWISGTYVSVREIIDDLIRKPPS